MGFAVAAHRDDEGGLAAARGTIEQWRRVLRTRRALVVRTGPVCAGARRATALAEEALAGSRRPVYLLGRAAALFEQGVVVVDSVDCVPDAGTVVVAAHGVGLVTPVELAARGLRVVDATCPLVADAHREVREFADRGDTVLMVGRPGDAVTEGLVGQAPEDVFVVSSVREAGEVLVADPDRVSFVLSPGMPVDDSVVVLAALRSRFPRLRGQHPDGWCYAASDRRAAVRSVAGGSDLLLIVGDADDSDRHELAAAVAGARCQIRHLVNAGQLRADWLASAVTIGIATTSSAPAGLVDEIVTVLSGLGPLSVAHQQITTDVATDVSAGGEPEVPPDRATRRCVTSG